jgi:peptidyl-prolyl cis-trans isomerase A (cyclophilin A)
VTARSTQLARFAPLALVVWLASAAIPPVAVLGQDGGSAADAHPHVLLVTDKGEIEIELYPDKAPVTVANFLRYVDEGIFERQEGAQNGSAGATFYRVVRLDNQPDQPVPIEVIQGGLTIDDYDPRRLAPIRHESTAETGLEHRDGTFSMARNAPGSASSEFFICVGDQPELDFGGHRNPDGQGFAAFGQVVRGMDVVRAIQKLPDDNQMLVDPVEILDIRRLGPR